MIQVVQYPTILQKVRLELSSSFNSLPDILTSPTALVIEGAAALAIVAGILILLRKKRTSASTSRLVMIASFSALYVVFRLIPTFPMFGIPGASFRAGDFLAPLFGVILGPFLGPLAVIIGTIIGFSLVPPVFLGFDFLPGATSAAIVGLVVRGKRVQAAVLNIIIILVFAVLPFTSLLIPVGTAFVPYLWLHLVGLALLVSPIAKWASREINSGWDGLNLGIQSLPRLRRNYYWRHFWAFFSLALPATLAQHLTGGILTQLVVGLNFHAVPGHQTTWLAFWTFVFWIYPVERTIIATVAALIGSAAVLSLKVSGLAGRLPSLKMRESERSVAS